MTLGDGFVVADVLTIDRFGNVQLAAAAPAALDALGDGPVIVDGRIAICGKTFGDVPAGSMVVFEDSAGYLAIAVNSASAVDVLGVAPGALDPARPHLSRAASARLCNDGRMPEGDTVKNHANALTKALAGQTVTRSDFRVPALATADLAGYRIVECGVRGKHLLLRFTAPDGSARTLHSHLRMDGTWRTFRAGERLHGRPAHTIRVLISTETTMAVGFHLHELALMPTAEESSLLDYLGPDLLGPDWDADEAVRRLTERPIARSPTRCSINAIWRASEISTSPRCCSCVGSGRGGRYASPGSSGRS